MAILPTVHSKHTQLHTAQPSPLWLQICNCTPVQCLHYLMAHIYTTTWLNHAHLIHHTLLIPQITDFTITCWPLLLASGYNSQSLILFLKCLLLLLNFASLCSSYKRIFYFLFLINYLWVCDMTSVFSPSQASFSYPWFLPG